MRRGSKKLEPDAAGLHEIRGARCGEAPREYCGFSSRETLKAGPGGGPACLSVSGAKIPLRGDGAPSVFAHDPYTRTGRLGRRDVQVA